MNSYTTKLERLLFFSLVFALPFNLGKHFIFNWNYVNGILVDYLIPTVYVQDIIITGLVILWVYKLLRTRIRLTDLGWHSRLLFLFLLAVFLSILVSINPAASLYAFARLILYVLFALYVAYNFDIENDLLLFMKVLTVSVFFIAVLAIVQWLKQGAVFNNYLFFGEQPYSYSTFGLAKESLFGRTVIPVYGTFKHPNVFGGFIAIVLLWIINFKGRFKDSKFRDFATATIVLGVLVLFLTFSLVAYLAFGIGVTLLILIRKLPIHRAYFLLLLLPFVLLSLSLPVVTREYFEENPSFYRRSQLHEFAQTSIKDRYMYGMGLNTGSQLSSNDVEFAYEVKLPQPVHNIFFLVFVEAGIFAVLFLILFFGLTLKTAPNLLFISFIQLILLGLFDHYLLTIHQGGLLLWLTVGIHLAYTLSNVQQS